MMAGRHAARPAAVSATAVAALRLGMLHLLSWTPVLQPDTPPQLPVAVLQTLYRWPRPAGHCMAAVSRYYWAADSAGRGLRHSHLRVLGGVEGH
jgi:hypothetical protein